MLCYLYSSPNCVRVVKFIDQINVMHKRHLFLCGCHHCTRGDPKITRFFFLIVYFSEHFQNLITLKILSLRINTLIPPLFPMFETVVELLQSDSLQCLRRFFPHLYILKTLSFTVPLHSWKQKKIAGCQVRGVGGCETVVIPFFVRNCRTLNAVWAGCCDAEATHLTATIRGIFFAQHHAIA